MVPIQLTGHSIEINDNLRNFVEKKFSRLQKHAERITSIHVILTVVKLQQKAEAKVHIPKAEIYASADSEDMYKTIDILLDKLVAQLDKRKGKREGKNR
jgi:putative sigma-54 modulation protein